MPVQTKERGQALVIIAIAIVVLVGILGLVVDGGNVFLDRRRSQSAADSAALAAAVTRIRGQGDWVAAALKAAANNGYASDGTNNTVTVYSPPSDGPFVGNTEYIQVKIESHVQTYFAKVIGVSQVTNNVQATARSKPSEVKQLLNGLAVVSLAPSSNCSTQKAFWVHGEATLQISGGGLFVNSNNKDCAFMQQGSGSIRLQNSGSINVVGGVSIQKPQLLSPGVAVGGSPINYPPPFYMPDANGCDKPAAVSEDGTSMTPGNWEDAFPPEGVTNLEPGSYCLKDGFNVEGNQTLQGHDIVFIVQKGEVQFGGNADLQLDAPASGDYKGLLIYLPMENDSQVVLNGGPASSIMGTILAPASTILIKGNSSPNGFHSQIIGYRVEADGSSKVIIVYNNDQNYNAVTMPEVQLSQ